MTNQHDTPEKLERLSRAGGPEFKKDLLTKAAKAGGVKITWAGFTFDVPERSYYNHKPTAKPYPLRGSVSASDTIDLEPPVGGSHQFTLIQVLKIVLLGGTMHRPEQESRPDFDRKFIGFIEENCDLASIDLDETFCAIRRPQDPQKHFHVGPTVADLIGKVGLRPGSGFFSATARARNHFHALEAFRTMPADAWEKKLIDAFGEVVAA